MNYQQSPTNMHTFLHVTAQEHVSLRSFKSIWMVTHMNAFVGIQSDIDKLKKWEKETRNMKAIKRDVKYWKNSTG